MPQMRKFEALLERKTRKRLSGNNVVDKTITSYSNFRGPTFRMTKQLV